MSKKLPNRVREWRQARNYSLGDLYDLTGLTRSETSKIELGGRGLRFDKLLLLAAALQVPPQDLLHPADAKRDLASFPGDPSAVPPPPPKMDLKLRELGKLEPEAEPRAAPRETAVEVVPIRGLVRDDRITNLSEVIGQIQVALPFGMKGAYCVYSPGYGTWKPGDILIITPAVPARIGDVVIRHTAAGEGLIGVLERPPQAGETVHKVGATLLF